MTQLEKKSVEMIDNKVANIEDQEQEEVLSELSTFPIDVLSETVEFPPSLDWSPFVAGSSKTAVEASGSL